MLKRSQFAALQIIREWTTDDVLVLLTNHGLTDCCEAFRKRDIDGEALLVLTEGKLALWKRDIGNSGISKLAKLVQNVKDQPEKYVGIGKIANSQTTTSSAVASEAGSVPVQQKEWVSNQINTPSSLSDSGSWDTDFEDEEENSRNKGTSVSQGSRNGWRTNSNNAQSRNNVNQVPTGHVPNGIGTGNKLPDLVDSSESAVEYMNLDEESLVDEKPSVPSRPPLLGPKPTSLGNATSNKACSLPKPPSVNENNLCHVKNLISNLTPPSTEKPENTQYDEEYIYYEEYEEQKSVHGEEQEEEYIYYDEQEEPKTGSNVQELSALLNQSLKVHFQKLGLKSSDQNRPPVPPPNSKPKINLPESETPPTPPRPQARQVPVEEDYESDEYESIQEHQPVVLENLRIPARNLEVPNPTPSEAPPPLPAKPWSRSRDSPSPVHLQTPPRKKSDDGSIHSSPGNSADGVSGLFGVFRKVINRPSNYATPATTAPCPERVGPLLQNLALRLGTEMADVAVGMKRRLLYPIRRLLSRYDDVLPPDCAQESHSPEKTPTPEPKKAAPAPVPSQKPPPVEQRLPQSNNRPLPPTPEGKNLQLPEKNTAPAPRTTSKVVLTQQPWYHNVDRKKAEEMLRNAEDGCFIVRPSSQSQNPLTLTLWYKNRLYNISIRHRPDGRYALGTEKQNEQSFTSVEEMVQNYHSEKLLLYSGGERTGRTLLTTSPARTSSS